MPIGWTPFANNFDIRPTTELKLCYTKVERKTYLLDILHRYLSALALLLIYLVQTFLV